MSRRVVITGIGTVNPLGNNTQDFWKNIQNVENGIDQVTKFDASPFKCTIGGMVKDFDPEKYITRKEARRMDSFTLFSLISAMEAFEDSGLIKDNLNPEKIGVILGNGIGGIETLAAQVEKLKDVGPRGIHPLFIPKMISNIGPGNIAIKLNAHGPCYTVVTACSSGTDAIGGAMKWIKEGVTDIMIAGGSEAPFHPVALGGFCALQALSTRYNDTPEKASRPFDKDRDGFVMSEGSGMIILEEMEHALKRGAKIYVELGGYGVSCDAHHLTAPHPEGRGAISAIKMAIQTSGLKPEDIDYINAHGTSTPINDPTETKAIKIVFGEHAKKLKVSSTKSMTGHLLGGAGGVEAVLCALAIKDQYFPATRNLDEPDPECDLDYVPNKGMKGTIRAAISNSLGFGGHNGILCFKKFEK